MWMRHIGAVAQKAPATNQQLAVDTKIVNGASENEVTDVPDRCRQGCRVRSSLNPHLISANVSPPADI
jgi:hypothetical protein